MVARAYQREPTGPGAAVRAACTLFDMEFLVEFQLEVPDGASKSEVEQRTRAEAVAAAGLAAEGHLLRLWRPTDAAGGPTAVGVYTADSRAELDALLGALPLADWLQMTVVPLSPHPNDPGREG